MVNICISSAGFGALLKRDNSNVSYSGNCTQWGSISCQIEETFRKEINLSFYWSGKGEKCMAVMVGCHSPSVLLILIDRMAADHRLHLIDFGILIYTCNQYN